MVAPVIYPKDNFDNNVINRAYGFRKILVTETVRLKGQLAWVNGQHLNPPNNIINNGYSKLLKRLIMENEILDQKILEYIMFRGGDIQNNSLADANEINSMITTYSGTTQFLDKLVNVFRLLQQEVQMVNDEANALVQPDFITMHFFTQIAIHIHKRVTQLCKIYNTHNVDATNNNLVFMLSNTSDIENTDIFDFSQLTIQ